MTYRPVIRTARDQVITYKPKHFQLGDCAPPLPVIPDSPCIMCREGHVHTSCEDMIGDWTEQEGKRLTVKEFHKEVEKRRGRETSPERIKRARAHADMFHKLKADGKSTREAVVELCKQSNLNKKTIRWDLKIAGVKGATKSRQQ